VKINNYNFLDVGDLTAVFGRHLPAVLRCLSTRLSVNLRPRKIWRAFPHRRFKQNHHSSNFIPTSKNGGAHYPPENRGLPPKGKQVENGSHCLFNFLLPHCKMYIFQSLCPRLSSLHSSFFTLPSTPPRPTHSFTTPLHYSFITHSTEPLIFLLLPSIIRFSLFALNSLDHSPALMSSIRLRIAELVQHRSSCVREIRRLYGTAKAAKYSGGNPLLEISSKVLF
jgi:hypothetical protein